MLRNAPLLFVAFLAVSGVVWAQPEAAVIKGKIVLHGKLDPASGTELPGTPVLDDSGTQTVAYAIDNTVDLAKFWMAAKNPARFPTIDFSRFSVLVVFGTADEVSIRESNTDAWLEHTGSGVGSAPNYTVVLFPRAAATRLLSQRHE